MGPIEEIVEDVLDIASKLIPPPPVITKGYPSRCITGIAKLNVEHKSEPRTKW